MLSAKIMNVHTATYVTCMALTEISCTSLLFFRQGPRKRTILNNCQDLKYTRFRKRRRKLKALCNEFFDGEIFALRYSVLCTGSKDANRFPKLQVALFL